MLSRRLFLAATALSMAFAMPVAAQDKGLVGIAMPTKIIAALDQRRQ